MAAAALFALGAWRSKDGRMPRPALSLAAGAVVLVAAALRVPVGNWAVFAADRSGTSAAAAARDAGSGPILSGPMLEGVQIRTGRPVFDEVTSRLGTSLELAVLAIVMALAIGIAGGGVATLFRGRWIDRAVMGLATIGMSVPNYFAATLFVLAVSLYLPDLGVISYAPLSKGLLANVQSLFFPALALAILSGSTFCHYVRGATEDIVRNADFIRTARSKGASQRRILLRHVLPNALVPLATVAGLQLAYLIGGAVVIESIFALPGLGQLLLAAIAQRDYPIIQGCVLMKATTFVMINLAVDLLYPVIDPRVQITGRGR
jgi:peptide/nickel transport system permease protein